MSRATAIAARVSRILNNVGPQERISYKRVITRSGGDSLIGRPGSVSVVDTVFTPQPQYTRQATFQVGRGALTEDVLSGDEHAIANTYQFLMSSDSISKDDLENEDVSIVLKDAAGNSEQFEITDYEATAFTGVTLIYVVYAKSTKRP